MPKNRRIRIRRSWRINPRTRVKPGKRIYRRALLKKEERESLKEFKIYE